MCELQEGGAQEDGPSEGTARMPRRSTVRTPSALSARPLVRDGKADSEHDQHQCPATAKAEQAAAEASWWAPPVPRRSGRACRGLGGGSSRGSGPGGQRTEGRRQRRKTVRPPMALVVPPGRGWRWRAVNRDVAEEGRNPEAAPDGQIAAEKRGHHELRRTCRRAVSCSAGSAAGRFGRCPFRSPGIGHVSGVPHRGQLSPPAERAWQG